MTQEQKAKAYDKVVNKLRGFLTQGVDPLITRADVQDFFPELRESEDEKMIKFIVKQLFNIRNTAVYGSNLDRELTEAIDWLEKQGEKPQGKSALEAIQEKEVDNRNYVKPTDNVKPKFKVGDWIVGANSVLKIISLNDELNCYIAVTLNNEEVKIPYYFDDGKGHMCSYHLWTIQDAKDGDVLTAIGFHNNCTFIFNGLDNWKFDEPNGDRAVATGYCCISASADNIEFGIQGPDCIDVDTVKPATKIQRDLLFSKMKEAGYDWDVEKKELKEIEQESTAWSEVDKDFMHDTLSNLTELKDRYGEGYGNVGKCIEWLKTFKDRVQPQPKQEWSQEDEQNLEGIIDELTANKSEAPSYDYKTYDRFLAWLKSFKNRIQH